MQLMDLNLNKLTLFTSYTMNFPKIVYNTLLTSPYFSK